MYMYIVCDIHYMLDIVYCIAYTIIIYTTEYSVSNIDTLRSTNYTVYSVYTIQY